MNLIKLILISLLVASCSSLTKGESKNFIKVKTYRLDIAARDTLIPYYSTKEHDQHCFKDVDDREIITVSSHHTAFAIDHFYKRVSKIDVVRSSSLGATNVHVTAIEDANFELEMADCIMKQFGMIKDFDATYTSFRLKR